LFKDIEEEGSALALKLPWLLTPLSLLLHIMDSHALTLLKLPCYFTKLNKEIIGVFAFQEYHKRLLVASLGVRKQYRRLGIGGMILQQIEKTAIHMHKQWLEVDVLRKNVLARRLYTKSGFTFIQHDGKRSIMRGRKVLHQT
jgi:GNAT superfamily N-acetyltransferase